MLGCVGGIVLRSSRRCGGQVGARGARPLTAIGGLIAAVHTVIVPVTDPDSGDAALGDGALELVGSAGHFSCRVGESEDLPIPPVPQHHSSRSPPSPSSKL